MSGKRSQNQYVGDFIDLPSLQTTKSMRSSPSTPTSSFPNHPFVRPPISPSSLQYASPGVPPITNVYGYTPQNQHQVPIDWNLNYYNHPNLNLPNLNVNIQSTPSSQSSFSPQEPMPSYNQFETHQTPFETQPSETSESQPPLQTQPEYVAATQDDDIQVLSNPPPKPVGTRSCGFKDAEDKLITNLWLKHSEDGITGVEQQRDVFWKKITEEFKATTTSGVERKQKALSARWKLLQTAVTKFCAVFSRNTIKNPSGKCVEDLLAMSLMDYQARHGTAFKFMAIWDIVKTHPKWIQAMESLQEGEKRSLAQKQVIHEVAGGEDGDVVVPIFNKDGTARPPGRDNEKQRREAAQASEAAIKSSSDTFAKYLEKQDKIHEENSVRAEARMKLLQENAVRNNILAESALKMAKTMENKEKRKNVEVMKELLQTNMFSNESTGEVEKTKAKMLRRVKKWVSCLSSSDSE